MSPLFDSKICEIGGQSQISVANIGISSAAVCMIQAGISMTVVAQSVVFIRSVLEAARLIRNQSVVNISSSTTIQLGS